jgi:hypothetical protein
MRYYVLFYAGLVAFWVFLGWLVYGAALRAVSQAMGQAGAMLGTF